MPRAETVLVDPSQFPETVRDDLLESLQSRHIQPKFHYESYRQVRKWLALHEAHSPARREPECLTIYDQAFEAAADLAVQAGARVIGLGCGGGQKDARLLQCLARRKVPLAYTACDASVPLVLTAMQAARAAAPSIHGDLLVCDLAKCVDLGQSIGQAAGGRFFTFFGMIPNFEPNVIVPRLGGLLKEGDWLLFSANLAPGTDYAAGVESVLPGYDNRRTREWLSVFLLDMGAEPTDGEIRFSIEDSMAGYKRIVADFHFLRPLEMNISERRLDFQAGERIRLFFSYRFQPAQIESLLRRHSLETTRQWITPSGEEGVFLTKVNKNITEGNKS